MNLPPDVRASIAVKGTYFLPDAQGRSWYAKRSGREWFARPGIGHPARHIGLAMSAPTLKALAASVASYEPASVYDPDSFTSV